MKTIAIIPILFFFACSEQPTKTITEVIYQTDTVYVEAEDHLIRPWDDGCMDTSMTQYDMNVCSRDTQIRADSITGELHALLIANIKQEADAQSEQSIQDANLQIKRLEEIHAHFAEIRQLAADFEAQIYFGGSMAPLMYNSTKTWVSQFEYDLLDSWWYEYTEL